jgi:hypothetical protein
MWAEIAMQYLIDHSAQIDHPRLHGLARPPATLRHRRRARDAAIRVHHKVFAGMALLVLLLAYDMASRIDEHVSCFSSHIAGPSVIDDTAATMNRF